MLFAQQPELLPAQDLSRERDVIDRQRDRRHVARTLHHRIRKSDVQLRAQQIQAQSLERVALVQLHDQHVHLAERDLMARQQQARLVRVVGDRADHRVVARVVHAHRTDPHG